MRPAGNVATVINYYYFLFFQNLSTSKCRHNDYREDNAPVMIHLMHTATMQRDVQ